VLHGCVRWLRILERRADTHTVCGTSPATRPREAADRVLHPQAYPAIDAVIDLQYAARRLRVP